MDIINYALSNKIKKYVDDISSSNQVQPDWSQSDESAADYVKNRPFYSETAKIEIFINNPGKFYTLEGFPEFAVGDTVTVKIDDTEYSLVVFDDSGYPTIGDTFDEIDAVTGKYGWNIYAGEDGVWFHALESHSVSYLGERIHKLDNKFIDIDFDEYVRAFNYYFKDWHLSKVLYDDDGNTCHLYICNGFIMPKEGSLIFGYMSDLGCSEVCSVLKFSCFIHGYAFSSSGIYERSVVLGTDIDEMVEHAESYGYTHTTNPKA